LRRSPFFPLSLNHPLYLRQLGAVSEFDVPSQNIDALSRQKTEGQGSSQPSHDPTRHFPPFSEASSKRPRYSRGASRWIFSRIASRRKSLSFMCVSRVMYFCNKFFNAAGILAATTQSFRLWFCVCIVNNHNTLIVCRDNSIFATEKGGKHGPRLDTF